MENAEDLVLLAADKQMAEALRGILSRPRALAIRAPSFQVYQHPHKDPGCRREAHQFLRPFHTDFRRALVLFDYVGCGVSGEVSPTDVEDEVEARLSDAGWGERARCIVIDPELEVWVWSDSRAVDQCLGWEGPQRVHD